MKATKFSQFMQTREELKCVDRPHWIYVVEALIWSFIIVGTGIFAYNFLAQNFIYPSLSNDLNADGFMVNIIAFVAWFLMWGSIIFAILYFLNRVTFWASTFIFASDRRLYMKTGLIRVLVKEISYEEIRKTDINYGLLGRFLGYGKLMMDARFVEDTELVYTYRPEAFTKLIHYENDLLGDINLSYVTNGMKDKVEQIVPQKESVKDQVSPMSDQKKFVDYAFSDEEKEGVESQEDHFQSDFEDVVNIPNKQSVRSSLNKSDPIKV